MNARPWMVQARFRLTNAPRKWGGWYTVETYGSEDRAREKMEAFDAEHKREHETRIRVRTAEAFLQAYGARAGMTVSRLVEGGKTAVTCDCDDVRCLGWRMTGPTEGVG